MLLDLNKERELLNRSALNVWDQAVKEIDQVAKELHLTKAEKEAYLVKTMADIRYRDMQLTNSFFANNNDPQYMEIVKQNRADLYRMADVINKIDTSRVLANREDEINARIENMHRQANNTKENNK